MPKLKRHHFRSLTPSAAFVALACASVSHNAGAAEGFEVRYNLAGSLGGEMFAPPDQTGWAGAVVATHAKLNKLTGNDGNALKVNIPGGTVPLPAPTPSALYPSYGANEAQLAAGGSMTRWDLAFGYITPERFGGGRLAFGFILPFIKKSQHGTSSATTPALTWNPAVPSATQSAVQAQFGSQYQAAIAAQDASNSGDVTGFGDVELLAGWQYVDAEWRVLAGASVVLPTGKYDAAPGPDAGFGNFYTFRPAIQVAYLPTPDFGLATKFSVGLNTRNNDNDLRSGNWAGVEVAAGHKTPIGVVGLHAIHIQQYQDDDNNPFGASRYRTTNAGVFFTTKIPGIDAVTIQYMTTTSSRYAKAGDAFQVRVIKLF